MAAKPLPDFLYNEDFVKRLRSKTTSPAGGSKKL